VVWGVRSPPAWLAYATVLFRTYEPPRTRNRLSSNTQLYAKHSAVLWALFANTSTPSAPTPARFLPTDLVFHRPLPELQDLKICYESLWDEWESGADATLVPLSVPPLRGWLTLTCFTRENIVKDMISLFGGLRFRHMDLFRVKCVRLLLDACAETLETLRLYPSDPYGEEFPERGRKRTQASDL